MKAMGGGGGGHIILEVAVLLSHRVSILRSFVNSLSIYKVNKK